MRVWDGCRHYYYCGSRPSPTRILMKVSSSRHALPNNAATGWCCFLRNDGHVREFREREDAGRVRGNYWSSTVVNGFDEAAI